MHIDIDNFVNWLRKVEGRGLKGEGNRVVRENPCQNNNRLYKQVLHLARINSEKSVEVSLSLCQKE